MHQYSAGVHWHIDDDDLESIAQAEQQKRFKASPWLEEIEKHLTGKTEVRVNEILDDCLDIPKGQRGQHHMNEVVRCLQHLGWEQRQVRREDGRVRVYMPALKADSK